MSKKNVIFIIILIVVAFFSVKYFMGDNKSQTLVASGHTDWAPIMYQEDNKIIGAGPEIVTKIFDELGVKVSSKYVGSWDVVQEKTKGGSIDVIVAAYKTAEREAYMDYSIPYTIDPVVLVVRKGIDFAYEDWEDLADKKGVVMTGDSYGQDFDDFIDEELVVKEVGTPGEAFSILEKEEADYFVYALYSAENYIFQNNLSDKFEMVSKYISAEYFYLTISKKSPFANLLPQVNEILKEYEKDGTIKAIIEKNTEILRENK
jgi:polar amino acid transport system substrate-binding protein